MEDSSTTASSSLTSSSGPITWIEVKMDDSLVSSDSLDWLKDSDSSKSKSDEKGSRDGSESTVIDAESLRTSTDKGKDYGSGGRDYDQKKVDEGVDEDFDELEKYRPRNHRNATRRLDEGVDEKVDGGVDGRVDENDKYRPRRQRNLDRAVDADLDDVESIPRPRRSRIVDDAVAEPDPVDELKMKKLTIKEPERESSPETTTLQQQMVKDENGFVYYKCRFCGLTYNYLNTLKAHERVHDVNQPYACNKCGEAFHFMCELEYHAKSHLQQKGYKCDCGRTFYQYTDLLYHKHPEDEPDEFPLPQPEAPEHRVFKNPFTRPAIPESEFPTPDFAVKGFEPKHPLKVYSDIRSKPYICQYCSKSYSDSRQLAFHISSHRGEKNFSVYSSRYLMCRNDRSYISPGAAPSIPDLFLRRNYEDILHF